MKFALSLEHNGADVDSTILPKLTKGRIQKRPNTAGVMDLNFSNKGDLTHCFTLGDTLKIYMGLGTTYPKPVFSGYIWDKIININDGIITVSCLDFIGKLEDELIKIDDIRNYDNKSVDAATKDIVDSLNGNPLNFSSSGVYPQVLIPVSGIRSNYGTKLEALNNICQKYAFDSTTYPASPLTNYYIQDFDSSGNEIFLFKKESPKDTATAIKTYTLGTDIFVADSEERDSIICNKLTVLDNGGNYVCEYTSYQSILEFGELQNVINKPYTNVSDAWEFAYRYVERNKSPKQSLNVKVRDAFRLLPYDWINIDTTNQVSDFSISGKHRVHDITIDFSRGNVDCIMQLDAGIPYMTDYVGQ